MDKGDQGCRHQARQLGPLVRHALVSIKFSFDSKAKSRARLASPQPRPTSPVNGAGGRPAVLMTLKTRRGSRVGNYFCTRLSDCRFPELRGFPRVGGCDRQMGRGTCNMSNLSKAVFGAIARTKLVRSIGDAPTLRHCNSPPVPPLTGGFLIISIRLLNVFSECTCFVLVSRYFLLHSLCNGKWQLERGLSKGYKSDMYRLSVAISRSHTSLKTGLQCQTSD